MTDNKQPQPRIEENNYVINASKNVPTLLHVRDALLTFLLWGAYFYLIRDFYYFALDLFSWFNDDVSIHAYPKLHVLKVLREYSIWLGLFIFAFVAWPIYNRIRFRNKKRRGFTTPVSPADLGSFYGVAPEQITEWQSMREATVHLDADGKIVQVDLL